MTKTRLLQAAVGFVAILTLLAALLPSLLHWAGFHPKYRGDRLLFSDKKALIITTSQRTLGDGGKETGVYASEMTIPYYEFSRSGIQVDIGSIEGGEIPIEPISMRYPLLTFADKRFKKDALFQEKVRNSLPIDDLDFTEYDLIYLAGGWGASYDLGSSVILGQKITEAYSQGIILGSVCHGALGFLQAKDPGGSPLVQGKRLTAVTNKQIEELGLSTTPMHPEKELRLQGAEFESRTAFRDFLATHLVVDGTIVTGQNQNSSAETAQAMMRLLAFVE